MGCPIAVSPHFSAPEAAGSPRAGFRARVSQGDSFDVRQARWNLTARMNFAASMHQTQQQEGVSYQLHG